MSKMAKMQDNFSNLGAQASSLEICSAAGNRKMRALSPSRSISHLIIVLSLGLGLVSCRATKEDTHRWALTQQGPQKLVAVMTHDKYDEDVRLEAATSLITMRPRAGQYVGLELFVSGLTQLTAEQRARLLQSLVPRLITGMEGRAESEKDASDPSIPYKDAAYILLNNSSNEALLSDEELGKELKAGMANWASVDFMRRLDDSTQKYAMNQVLRLVGPAALKPLPALINGDIDKLDSLAQLIAEYGDISTKNDAVKRLLSVATETSSKAWLDKMRPELQRRNEKAGQKVEGERLETQLTTWQAEELARRIFPAMQRLGNAEVGAFLVHFAESNFPEESRAGALAALQRNVSSLGENSIEALIKIAENEKAGDQVRNQAFARIGELPREKIIGHLYSLFNSKEWRTRYVAADLALSASKIEHIDEFMAKIGEAKGFEISEPLVYGKKLSALTSKSFSPAQLEEKLSGYLNSKKGIEQIIAAAYYLEAGSEKDRSKLEAIAHSKNSIPSCDTKEDDCRWSCRVANEEKEISKVGDFVSFCVLPNLKK